MIYYTHIEYGCIRQPSSCPRDPFDHTTCDFYADMTYALWDGLLGPTLELLKILLGLRLQHDDSLRLHGETVVHPINYTAEWSCRTIVSVSREITASWSDGVGRVEVDGVNAGIFHNCSVSSDLEYVVGGGVDLVHMISKTLCNFDMD